MAFEIQQRPQNVHSSSRLPTTPEWQDTRASWADFLQAIIADSRYHARWLNTLSLLEHIGSRKILKTLDSYSLDETLLRHIAEEARHAHFFKRLSHRILPEGCQQYRPEELFCGEAAVAYFQQLDHGISNYLEPLVDPAYRPTLCYLAVTTVIELRATQLYALYEEMLRASGAGISLRSVLNEEERHMEEMLIAFSARNFQWDAHAPALLAIEAPLMQAWLEQLHAGLKPGPRN